MRDIQRLLRNSSAGVGYSLVSAVLMFLLYREALAALGAEGIGVWSIVLASTTLARVSEFGLSAASEKFVAQHLSRGEEGKAARIVETTLVSTAAIVGCAALGSMLLVPYLLPFFMPEDSIPIATSILPIAFAAFWFTSSAASAFSGLAGCRRYDVRSGVQLIALVIYVGLGIWAVRRGGGLEGLALAQLVQGLAACVLAWVLLRKFLPEISIVPWRWDLGSFREVVGYGAGFQLATLLQLFGDPMAKALMSRFGGLSATGYFELANQLVTKVHSLVTAAFQVLTAEVASLAEQRFEHMKAMFQWTSKLSALASVLGYGAVLSTLPLVSLVWIGEVNGSFVAFSAILAVGYGFASYTSAAYFLLLGLGKIRVLVSTRILMGVVNLTLGVLLGWLLGGIGVAVGWCLGIISGTVVLLVASIGYMGGTRFSRQDVWACAGVLLSVSLGYAPYALGEGSLLVVAGPIVGFLCAAAFVIRQQGELRRFIGATAKAMWVSR